MTIITNLILLFLRSVKLNDKLRMILVIIWVFAIMNTYIHKTEQRLRVRSDYIKENPKKVKALISQLEEIEAIESISHKKYAGSVAINFDNRELDCDSLIEILDSHYWTQSSDKASFVERAMVSGTKTLVKGAATIALNRLLGPSISRVVMSLG